MYISQPVVRRFRYTRGTVFESGGCCFPILSTCFWNQILGAGGGFKDVLFYFHPDVWAEMGIEDLTGRAYFSNVVG